MKNTPIITATTNSDDLTEKNLYLHFGCLGEFVQILAPVEEA
jgi:hypothetical protein